MNLSRKTLLLLIAASVLSVVLSVVVLRSTVYATFIELEKNWAANNTSTVEAVFKTQMIDLLSKSSEYSQWDDTYQYLMEGNPDYFTKNLTNHVLSNLDVDAIILLDKQGSYDGSITWGPDNKAVYPSALPFAELESIIKTPLIVNEDIQEHAGILSTSHGMLLLATRSVTRTDESGPSAGSVLFLRFLNKSRISALQDQFNVSFDVIPVNSARLPTEFMNSLSENLPGRYSMIQEPSRLLNYRLIRDLVGRPAFVLEVITQREMTTLGSNAVNLALMFLTLTSLLYLLVSNLSLKRLIVGPISQLTKRVARLQSSGDLSTRLHSRRNDELGTLTRQIDAFVVQLDAAQSKLITTRDTAVEASKAKSEFLATMSHEIRTPINGVLGMTELLLTSKGLSKQQQHYAETVHQSGNALLRIINDILDIAKVEAGKLELEVEPFNLRHLVEECLEQLAERAHGKGLDLIGDIPFGTHTQVRGDPARLRQILINLVANAVKFTEQGEIIVRVMELDENAGAASYRIEVEDTGMGIGAEHTEMIFEPFSQKDSSTTRQFGGTGLGLSICEQLVRLMNGAIGVNSTPGSGSTFWFTAQLGKEEETTQYPQSKLLAAKSVLVINNSKNSREILRYQLEGWRMHVMEAFSGVEALDQLADYSGQNLIFDLILLDLHLPKIDGLKLTQAIRQVPGYRHVPQVMLSPLPSVSSNKERRQGRIDAWLSKPVRQEHLYDTLVKVLDCETMQSDIGQNGQIHPDIKSDGSNNSLRILLAEDNEVNQAVAQGMLHVLGHTISLACNGREAVAAIRSQEYDVVLMDCLMPEMDGFEATRTIREWEAQQNRAPTLIIALTANAIKGDRENCLAAGMDDYLSKPVTIKQLTQVLERQTANNPARASSTHQAPKIKAPDNNQVVERGTFEALSKLGHGNGSSDFLASITNSYVDQATRMADDLPKMLDSGDLTSLQSVAHQLKSNSGYLGAQRVSRGAAALEHAVREGHTMPQLCVLMEQLRTNVREAVPEIIELAREMSGSRH